MLRVGTLLILASVVHATDLSKIGRKIVKAPRFEAPHQYYALLVLGQKAERRIWFVIDGSILYVDHNGNGDLTEVGERFEATSVKTNSVGFISDDRSWKLSSLGVSGRYTDIRVGLSLVNSHWRPSPKASNRLHMERFMKLVRETAHPNLSNIYLTIDKKRTQFCNTLFSMKPEQAPILHMDGPLTLGVVEAFMPFRFGADDDLAVAVGTPGIGSGAFSYIYYDEIPKDARPFAVVTLPNGKSTRHKLKEKC